MKKIINVVYGVLIVVLLVFFILLQGVKWIGLKPYVVTSGSMIPVYPVGSMIYVKEVDPESIEIGDAITFYIGNTNVPATHQVYAIDRENKQFFTQGINNFDSEGNVLKDSEPVSYSQFIGKPIFSIPMFGTVSIVCTTPPSSYAIFGFAMASCIFLIIIEKITEKETKDEKH